MGGWEGGCGGGGGGGGSGSGGRIELFRLLLGRPKIYLS